MRNLLILYHPLVSPLQIIFKNKSYVSSKQKNIQDSTISSEVLHDKTDIIKYYLQ